MQKDRKFPFVTISTKGERKLRDNHPWVYEDELDFTNVDYDNIDNGSLIDVLSSKGRYLGTGFLSKVSKIRIRILSNNANEQYGEEFWRRRVKYSIALRQQVMGEDISCSRLVFGEADGMPGLTVDLYTDILSVEVLSYGMDKVKDVVYQALVEELKNIGINVRGIYERNEAQLRLKEGLELYKGWYEADFVGKPLETTVDIVENNIKYTVDVENGQKTGFFLDQKYNRLTVAEFAKGKKVLDCFTHTGSFALNAAMGGASHVTAVDVSESAVQMACHNAVVNKLDDRMDFVCADVFDLLPQLEKVKEKYDLIILDPPAFTKSRKTTMNAKRGYKEINYRAMKMLPRGGFLVTCSCSHFMPNELFYKMLLEAAKDAGVMLKLIEERRASPDHPVLMSVPETDYLKFYLLQVV